MNLFLLTLSSNETTYTYKEIFGYFRNGFILSLFAINFFCLEYILPILGTMLLSYGCYLIREKNSTYKLVYYISVIRLILLLINFLLDWTNYNNAPILVCLQVIVSALLICLFFLFLDKSITKECKLHNLPVPHYFLHYIWFYLANLFATVLVLRIGILGILISIIIMLLNIIYLMFSFQKIASTLTDAKILIHVNPYKKQATYIIYCGILLYIIALIVTIFITNKGILVQNKSSESVIHTNLYQDTINHLKRLQMKDNILSKLTDQELQELSTCTSLDYTWQEQEVNGGLLHFDIYNATLANSNRLLVFYQWKEKPSNRLYEALECLTPFSSITNISGYSIYEKATENGPMLYSIPAIKKGRNFRNAPYIQLKLSNTGKNMGGYFSFTSIPIEKENNRFTIVYYYQNSILNLPYRDILDYMNNSELEKSNTAYSKLTCVIDFTKKIKVLQ